MKSTIAALIIVLCAGLANAATPPAAEHDRVAFEWRFGGAAGWSGWSPGAAITEPKLEDDAAAFLPVGEDPIIIGPVFEVATNNRQYVLIDIETDGSGTGELFYTNTTQGEHGGFKQDWCQIVHYSGPGRQQVTAWPFWGSLGKVIRLRLDPPNGLRCRLHAIRIMEMPEKPIPITDPSDPATTWRPMHAVTIQPAAGQLIATALRPAAMLIRPVEPFDAAERSMLRLTASCDREREISLHWATSANPGLNGEPIVLPAAKNGSPGELTLDLRQFPTWEGTISYLAIGFGSHGGEKLVLGGLRIEANDKTAPCLRLHHLGFERPLVREGQSARVVAWLDHVAGPACPVGSARLVLPDGQEMTVGQPMIAPATRLLLEFPIVAPKAGPLEATLAAGGQTFTRALTIAPRLPKAPQPAKGGYAVPEPKPIRTGYQIGVYYFPGWAGGLVRWRHQNEFPEREPLLGYYDEGSPEVADWHIKWAVENGITCFIYDWYWHDGREQLGEGLNQGFLKARYNGLMNFAVMWANHGPFASHTKEQLLQVTDYWIANYFKRPNYWMVDGKPYVSFFSPGQMLDDMGSEEKVRDAFEAMRQRCRDAGFPGLHIAACQGLDRGALESLKRQGYDSCTGYTYPGIGAPTIHSLYRGFMQAHDVLWKNLQQTNAIRYMPLLTIGWDARPWHGKWTMRRFARQPEYFREGLARLKANLDSRGEKIAILEAWNELGEGSYIEPNAEFGFADLESIREVFGGSRSGPVNIGPADLGQHGRYDQRRLGPATAPSKPEPVAINHLKATVEGDWLTIGQQRLAVPPAQVCQITRLPITLNDVAVHTWRDGNRLVIGPHDKRNLLPGSYVPGSLMLFDPTQPQFYPEEGRDYTVDQTWGAFALTKNSRLKPGAIIQATYRMSLRRLDALVDDGKGVLSIVPGTALADCPMPANVPRGLTRLANIYRPFNARDLRAEHVFPISSKPLEPPAMINAEKLEPVIARLRSGEPTVVVCWGDSVTAGGESSTPAKNYVGLLESGLKQRFPNSKLTVVNAGIGGSSTGSRWAGFQKEVLDHKPHLVTLEFINDMGYPLPELEQRYAEILKRIREAGAELLIITPHYSMPEWMGHPGPRGPETRAAVGFLRKFAAANGVSLADASKRWEQLESQGLPYEVLLRNGINHPEDLGHSFFAEEILRYFPAK